MTFDVESVGYLQLKKKYSGPGDRLAALIQHLGFQAQTGCDCEAMRQTMNDWGYLGCISHRAEILAFLKTKAEALGIPFDNATVWSAAQAALWSWKNKVEKSS